MFGDGKAAMDLMGQWLLGMQGPNSTSGKGLAEEDIGILSFPIVPGGKGKATDTLGRHQRLAREQVRAARRRSISSSSSARRNTRRRRRRTAPISRSSRARRPRSPIRCSSASPPISPRRPTTRTISIRISDPSVGRVINDVSVAVAAGEMTPEAAAAAIQEAADQQ